MHTIKDSVLIASTPARIREALTSKDDVRGWWTTDVQCNSEAREVTFTFEKTLGTVMSSTFRLDGADDRRVA